MKLTQISTGDWVPVEEIYAITVSPEEARVKLIFKNTLIYYIICMTHKDAEKLRDEIAGLVNLQPIKASIMSELKKRLDAKG